MTQPDIKNPLESQGVLFLSVLHTDGCKERFNHNNAPPSRLIEGCLYSRSVDEYA